MRRLAIVGVAALLAAEALMAQERLPQVHLIATGGTIASLGEGQGPLTGERLAASVPELARVADLTVEQFLNVGSSQVTPEHWRDLALRIRDVLRERPELAGVVVTHGTDTLEETAFFLDLTLHDERPVVVTGAMRPADAVGAEGPGNLLNAVRLAASPGARGLGALVLMNDEVFAAATSTKTNTSRLDAFAAPGLGPIGVVDPDAISIRLSPARRSDRPAFDAAVLRDVPRVDVVYSYAGADGALIDAAVRAGARGLVVATVGRGNLPRAQREAVGRAAAAGIPVVLSSRTGGGRVPVDAYERDDDRPRGAAEIIGAGHLNPQKARVLLILALAAGADTHELARLFRDG